MKPGSLSARNPATIGPKQSARRRPPQPALIMSHTPQEKAGDAASIEETSYYLGKVLSVAVLERVNVQRATLIAFFCGISCNYV